MNETRTPIWNQGKKSWDVHNPLKSKKPEVVILVIKYFGATEQNFNLRILCERYLLNQQALFYVFVDFKKAFDRVWHAALLSTIKQYNINTVPT